MKNSLLRAPVFHLCMGGGVLGGTMQVLLMYLYFLSVSMCVYVYVCMHACACA